MVKVYQTIVDKGKGNCMQAAMASLFDLELKDVPNFIEFENWFHPFYQFITENGYDYRGMLYNNWNHDIDKVKNKPCRFNEIKRMNGVNGLFFASVYSPKYYNPNDTHKTGHAVIIDQNFNIVHDPNPEYKNLEKYPLADEMGYNGIKDIFMIEKKDNTK